MSDTVTITLEIPADLVYDPKVVHHISQVKKIIGESGGLSTRATKEQGEEKANHSDSRVEDTINVAKDLMETLSKPFAGGRLNTQSNDNKEDNETMRLVDTLSKLFTGSGLNTQSTDDKEDKCQEGCPSANSGVTRPTDDKEGNDSDDRQNIITLLASMGIDIDAKDKQ